MDRAALKTMVKELKDVAKEVGVIEKSTKLRCETPPCTRRSLCWHRVSRCLRRSAAARGLLVGACALGARIGLPALRRSAAVAAAGCRLPCSDLIKAVRACKTAAEERALIAKESAAMRAEFRGEVRGAAACGRA